MASIRITKTMAENAAEKMSMKAYDEKIEAVKNEIDKAIEALVIKYIPAPVIACEKEYKDYFNLYTHASIYKIIDDEYGGRRSGYISGYLTFGINSSHRDICVSAEDFDAVKVLYNTLQKLREDKMNFNEKVMNALIALRTVNNVEKDFPEAMKFIEIPVSKQLPSPLLSDIRSIASLIQ